VPWLPSHANACAVRAAMFRKIESMRLDLGSE